MQDVFGKIMEDALSGFEDEYEIERDDGYTTKGSVKQYSAPIQDWFSCERNAIKLARGKVLDIGCGAGRVLQYLKKIGIEGTGIDNSPSAIEACKKRGLQNVSLMSAAEMDYPKNTFDTIVLFGNNFGILGETHKIVKMLKDIYRISTDNAIILACSRNPESTDNEAHIKYHQKNREQNLPPGYVTIRIRYKEAIGDWFSLLMVDEKDMELIANQAGWTIKRKFDGEAGLYVGVLEKRV
ncbi:MAG: methyltransferase domain-containing protein [Candidatus Lokiarchaeota archaeon]|nr:methyltransferase domain-containing protein [Candidatus Lokiarchaeota archaeon]